MALFKFFFVILLFVYSTMYSQDTLKWESLFNGVDLTQWSVKSKPADAEKKFWSVENGELVGEAKTTDHGKVWLYSDKEYYDFRLRLKYQINRGDFVNSGVVFRGHYDPEHEGGWLNGPQVDISTRGQDGSLFDETYNNRGWLAKVNSEELSILADEGSGWNEMEIHVEGLRFIVYLNGTLINDYNGMGIFDDRNHTQLRVGSVSGHLALQVHVNDIMKIKFKDLEIMDLTKSGSACTRNKIDSLHVWETLELTFQSEKEYSYPYTEVEMWVNLRGPENYNRRIWGFWDGGDTFKVRLTGIYPGTWHWESASNQDDPGLNDRKGSFETIAWTEEEKMKNPNRRGFIEPTASGHAWQYKDGTPFYMLADTWYGASTWRYPFKGEPIPADYVPDSTNFCFEGGIQWLKSLGFNSISLIAAHPHWSDDGGRKVSDDAGIFIRRGKTIHDGLNMSMHSINGHRSFEFPGKSVGKNDMCPDYDRINPEYFKDLDKKMFYLNKNGIVPYVETVRRDAGYAWEAYYEWPESFSRYINYLASRYGTMNMIYSLLHMDNRDSTIPVEKWKEAFDHWYSYYTDSMGMPFNQPSVIMGHHSTYINFGHITDTPWLEAHSVGNSPKDHTMLENLEECMKQKPYIPGYCNEPYYVGFTKIRTNSVDGELPPRNSDRDTYFARAHAYGHMMNGGLAGHIIGTGSRWPTGPGEKYSPFYPPPLETLHYTLLKEQARFIPQFLMSEGLKYRELTVSNEDLDQSARKREGYGPEKLEGWSHMVKTPDNKLVLVYFEQKAQQQIISNLAKNARYRASWFDPREGKWIDFEGVYVQTDSIGTFAFPNFPDGGWFDESETVNYALQDWAAKLVLMDNQVHETNHHYVK